MNIQVQIQVCRACLKPPEAVKLTELSLDSEELTNFHSLLQIQPSAGLPKTFCSKCIAKIKILTSFKQTSLQSDEYLKSFLAKISVEFTKSLPNVVQTSNADDGDEADIDQLLLEAEPEPTISKVEIKSPAKEIKTPAKNEKVEKVLRIEKIQASVEVKDDKEYIQDLCTEERLDDEDNIFGEEIYDIMEIDNEENEEKIYLEDTTNKQVLGEDESEFILVNFKSSSEDLTDTQFVVEEVSGTRPRRKPSHRLPKEIVDKYAQSTTTNQHICTKCVKVFSTRTNLIRHIQSHDGFKPYVCEICDKGFTQSGSLKQHMYIHSGERPYKCKYCDRAFTQGKTLKFHLRRHTEEKPFTCEVCLATFRQRDGLKRHLKAKHDVNLVYERPNQVQLTEETISSILIKPDDAQDEISEK